MVHEHRTNSCPLEWCPAITATRALDSVFRHRDRTRHARRRHSAKGMAEGCGRHGPQRGSIRRGREDGDRGGAGSRSPRGQARKPGQRTAGLIQPTRTKSRNGRSLRMGSSIAFTSMDFVMSVSAQALLIAEAVALSQIESRFRAPENASPTRYSVACAAVQVFRATSNDERQLGGARQRAVAHRPPRTTRSAAFSRCRRAACSKRLSFCDNATAFQG